MVILARPENLDRYLINSHKAVRRGQKIYENGPEERSALRKQQWAKLKNMHDWLRGTEGRCTSEGLAETADGYA